MKRLRPFSSKVNIGRNTGITKSRGESGLGFSATVMTGYGEPSYQKFAGAPAGAKKITAKAIKAKATKVVKYLAKKEGIKVSAEIAAKWIARLAKVLVSPALAPVIWLPEIIDLAQSRMVKQTWRNLKSQEWRRQELLKSRRRVTLGPGDSRAPFGESSRRGVYGNNYHSSVGWY